MFALVPIPIPITSTGSRGLDVLKTPHKHCLTPTLLRWIGLILANHGTPKGHTLVSQSLPSRWFPRERHIAFKISTLTALSSDYKRVQIDPNLFCRRCVYFLIVNFTFVSPFCPQKTSYCKMSEQEKHGVRSSFERCNLKSISRCNILGKELF